MQKISSSSKVVSSTVRAAKPTTQQVSNTTTTTQGNKTITRTFTTVSLVAAKWPKSSRVGVRQNSVSWFVSLC